MELAGLGTTRGAGGEPARDDGASRCGPVPGSRRRVGSVYASPPMFERTVLPNGPRVITARSPAPGPSPLAAYVLAGSRLESRELAGVAHFMEHLTFKGTAAYPTTRAVSEAIEGVGGSCNAATDRESTVYWARVPVRRRGARLPACVGELVARPLLREEDIEHERDDHRRGDPLVPRRPRRVRLQPLRPSHLRRHARWAGRSPATRTASAALTARRPSATFWERWYQPANLVRRGRGRHRARQVVRAAPPRPSAPAGRTGSPAPSRPRSSRPATASAREPSRDRPRRISAWAMPGAPPRPSRPVGARAAQHRARGGDEQPAVPHRPRGAPGWPTTSTRSSATTPTAGTLADLCRRRPARPAARARRDPRRARAAARERRARRRAGAGRRRTRCGRLELRLEESRHLASWLGAQEALHERTLTLEEAVQEIQAVSADRMREIARRLFTDDALSLAAIAPGRRGRTLEQRLRLA